MDSGEESDGENDDDAFEDDDDLDPFAEPRNPDENVEHSNLNSYSWLLMRYASIRLAQDTLEKFIVMAGIELPGRNRFEEPVYISANPVFGLGTRTYTD